MKVDIFTPVGYYGDQSVQRTSPYPKRLFDPEWGIRSIQMAYREMETAHRAGFDRLTLAEHHYSPAQMTPAPHIFAAAVGQRLPDAQIGILGTDLPLHNPVNIAEQYATLDNVLGGRLTFALLRGTPNEYATYGTNPWESRERFEEAVELVIRSLSEPEPFGWEGRYYRARNIAVFPGTVQQPHPRITLSGNSISSARFAGRMNCDLGISFLPAEGAAASVRAYYEAAHEAGWNPTPENVLYRQFAYVAETDSIAGEEVAEVGWPGVFGFSNPKLLPVLGMVGAAMAGVPKGVIPDMSKAPAQFQAPWVGGPETVLDLIRADAETIGFGRIELNLTGFDSARHESVVRGIELCGEGIIPQLHADERVAA